MPLRLAFVFVLIALLSACGNAPQRAPAPPPTVDSPTHSIPTTPSTRHYKDDAPPRREPLHRYANRPYTVLGREYVPATTVRRYRERGIASWYGRKFHGQKTSAGETYDMYKMTAAHPTLPLPSYARVTSVSTGKSVIVRV